MIENILETFNNLTPILWVSQIIGIIGFITITISYQFKKRKLILISTLAFLCFLLEQLFAEIYSAVIVNMFCIIRNVIMFLYLVRDNKELKFKTVLFINGLMWISVIIYLIIAGKLLEFDAYIPVLVVTISTFTQNSKHELVIKSGILVHEAGFLILYSVYGLPFSVLRQVILVASVIISIIILLFKNKKKNTENIDKMVECNQ